MRLRSVAVLGGGPGGLYFARLLKLRHPECRVDLYEQSQPDRTFGFGVGLATRTQRNLGAADPSTFADIIENSWSHEIGMTVGERKVLLPGDNLIAIGRAKLLDVLQRHAEDAGVVLHHGARRDVNSLDADLIVAADGVNSATREQWSDDFGATVTKHDGLYLWCGTDFALPAAVFRPAQTQYGTFVAHAYPYQSDRSTFLIETDEATWRRAGFDLSSERTPFDESDEESLAYLSRAFDEELGGHPLIGNRTRWLRFHTVRCARWHRNNVVLLGDAVHTAHYSIGSGTKLAMEDAIVLDAALGEAEDVSAALDAYERARRPVVEHLQETAQRSMFWWDTFPERLDAEIEQLLLAYMTRAGKVSIDKFAALAPEVMRDALAQFAGGAVDDVPERDLVGWVLDRPLTHAAGTWSSRLVPASSLPVPCVVDVPYAYGDAADDLVADIVGRHSPSEPVVALTCADDFGAVLTAFDISERLRGQLDVVVAAIVAPAHRELAAAALASGRVDLIALAV